MTRRLCISFTEAAEFRQEYESNLVKGGVFIRGAEGFELREPVEVELDLGFCGEVVALEAEVVHCVDAGRAGAGGSGVAVQFVDSATEIRERLERFLAETQAPAAESAEASGRSLFGEDEISGMDLEETCGSAAAEAALFDPSEVDLSASDEETAPPMAPEDRRRSVRVPARVAVRVDANGLSLGGRTRDLSEGGVLVSADASDLPVGKTVRLELVHPVSGERLQVEGSVARHIETEGTVAAVAIEFGARSAGDGITTFVKSVHELEEEGRRRGIFGAIEVLGMAALVEMFGTTAQQGTLSVVSGVEEGSISFERGTLRHAQLGELSGVKALARIFSWESGCFEFNARLDPADGEATPILLTEAIQAALRQHQQLTQSGLATGLDPTARFTIDREKLLAESGLTKTQEAVLDLVSAGFSVRRILDVIPESDAEIAEALHCLCDREIIRPA